MLNLSPLLKIINQIPLYHTLADALFYQELTEEMKKPLGLLNGARPAFLAALQADLKRPIVVITARADRARVLTEQIQFWASKSEKIRRFPDPASLPNEKVAWGVETIQGRLATLHSLVAYQHQTPEEIAPLIVTSARALMHLTLPPAEFETISLKIGQRINLNDLISQWIALGYRSEEVVEVPGSLSRRGGILDIFPMNHPQPIRIELFGDEIDSLRSFDPITQRSEDRLKQFTIVPASEALPYQGQEAADHLRELDFSQLQPGTRLTFEEDIAKLSRRTIFRGIEYYLPFFYGDTTPSILDYLPDNTLIFIEDPDELALVIEELESQVHNLKQDLISMGDFPPDWPDAYFDWATLSRRLDAYTPLVLGNTPFKPSDQTSTDSPSALPKSPYLQSSFRVAPSFGGQIKKVVAEVIKRKEQGERIVLVSRQVSRLTYLLKEETGMVITPIETLEADDPPPASGSITLIEGILAEGWSLRRNESLTEPPLLTVLTDSELFGWKKPTALRRRRRSRRRGMTPETFFADVNPGDAVVHIEHGIGRYVGIVKMDFGGVEREYLAVEYANTDKLYVPIHQADRLARYVGVDNKAPTLNRLGSADWNTIKRRTKKAVAEIAKDLLEIYAKREVTPGRTFGPDTEWQSEVEDSFPYIETEDQLQAIADVKRDMEKPKPMDRLICGDVGYGKTEVALRAAFKAVLDGTQVALLAPTTVLVQQHYQTFTQRLAAYPVKIEMLSRFRTPQQQEEILDNLQKGITDIIIGTQRLLSKDVQFKDLGLLIVDEEQRFGVAQKEHLKQKRTEVDVLTLTATPIPRTLYMSLSGVRDLSTIDTPPEERLPIQTTVAEYDENLIQQAILRELDRGGQVFYVHNRIKGIRQRTNRLKTLLPNATIDVGHGQMSSHQLERIMVEFVSGEIDILVSTTIIENGLDMPNVNTIIIERADRMGLAQLYQLRGRVGRGAVRAYAYLLTPKHHPIKSDARKRLEAIAEAGELGAGFRIAMRDLEIRGAGEFLGAKQHGHIGAVGFDLYSRLLGQAIRELKGLSPHQVTRDEASAYLNPLSDGIQINLPISVYVPEDYLPEEKIRLRLYRRLANLTNLKDIDEMGKELEDRFGHMPESVTNLLYQLKLKILAMEAGAKAILTEIDQIIIRADVLEEIDRVNFQRRISPAAKVTPRQIILPLYSRKEKWQAELEKTLRILGRILHDPAG